MKEQLIISLMWKHFIFIQMMINIYHVEKLKDMLNYVPTGKNNHALHFSFIEDIDVMHEFRAKVNSAIINFLNKLMY
jgi:hypothetical protein